MTDRKTASTINDAELDELYDDLDELRAVARGYCPACGRGDAAPTVEHWEEQRDRASQAEQQLRLTDAMRQQNLDAAAAAVQRAERAEAALARIQALADEHPAGIDTALIHAALDQEQRGG